MKKNTLFVVLFAMLCLAAITAVVSADNDGYNSFCYIDQYGCWVTDWDTELDEPTGKKIYVQFWSDEAREFFMGKDSKATVAPLPRKYGATMTMVKGDEAVRGAWKQGLWGFWAGTYEPWNYNNLRFDRQEVDCKTYADNGVCVVTNVWYIPGQETKDGRHPYHTDVWYVNSKGEVEADPMNGVFPTRTYVDPKDGVEWDNPVLEYCRAGHVNNNGCVIPGSLIRDIGGEDNKSYRTDDTGERWIGVGDIYYIPTGDGTYKFDFERVIWANPWF